jgi:hypothetical protein
MGKPLGEQPMPRLATATRQDIDHPDVMPTVELSGFPSVAMADAYADWLRSGAAHEAFGEWVDSGGIEYEQARLRRRKGAA